MYKLTVKAMVQYILDVMNEINDYLIYAVTESDIWYTGMMYHEAEEVGHWVSTYSVSRDLGVLKQVFRSQIHNMNE